MTIYSNYYTNNNIGYANVHPSFGEQYQGAKVLTRPIEQVENIVTNTVDSFVSEEEQNEEQKKSKKLGIKVASTVGVLGTLVMLLNPKFLGSMSAKLKTLAAKADKQSKVNGSFLSKIYKFSQTSLERFSKGLNILNNLNTSKDEGFKWLCTVNKEFSKIKNDTFRKFMEKFDRGFVKFMKKPHEAITRWFDAISKQTVYSKYMKANKEMNLIEELLIKYKDKLNPSERILLQAKLDKIKETQKYFSKSSIASRLKAQEDMMSNLEEETRKKITTYGSTMLKGNVDRTRYFKDNLDFWAESIMMPQRNKIEQQGNSIVNSLVGDGKASRGGYGEIIDILSPYLKKEEQKVLENTIQDLGKQLRNANKSECIEYFDKKRDLMLGSAPTDILTALGGLAFSGVMIGTADDKKERLSRAVTLAFPVVAGLGVSMATAAALYSGGIGLAVGTGSSIGLSKLGSAIDKKFITKNQTKNNSEEAQSA